MKRAADILAALLAALGRYPGHLTERFMGAYLAGWGLVVTCSPHLFEDSPYAWAALSGRPEWVYGLLFLVVGVAQVAVSSPVGRVRRRYVATIAGAVIAAGLALAFVQTRAWSGVYTYGVVATIEVALIARLWLLWHFVESRGVHIAAGLAFTATRRPTAP